MKSTLLAVAVLGLAFSAPPCALAEDNTHTVINVDTWVYPQDYIVGNTGTNNTLLLTGAGVELYDNNGVIGSATTANGNSVTVTESGIWNNYGSLAVGLNGSGNSLYLNQGVAASYGGFVGYTASSCNNTVTLNGQNGVWVVDRTPLMVGFYGSGNLLSVYSGGVLGTKANNFIGNAASASNNTVIIEGYAGSPNFPSFWDMNGTGSTCLLVGNSGGSGNGLKLSDYGQLIHVDGVAVGGWQGGGSAGNYVNIVNGGALLMTATLGEDFWIGNNAGANGNWVYVGSGNGVQSLLDLGVSGKHLFVGGNNGATSNNLLTVDGGGVVNNGSIWVGNGNGNAMTITNGGLVQSAADCAIGFAASDANSAATVTGPGSTWNTSSNLTVGNLGSGSTLTISNGGAVNVGGHLSISANAGATNNAVNISGGQLNVTTGTLTVNAAGATGSGALNITGGTVTVKQLTLASANGSITFNGGTLSSQGTTISNGADFVIGDTGGNATFTANGGAHVFQNALVVGNSGSGNALVVTHEATVNNAAGYIGYATGANSNAVTVSGSSSAWNNSGALYVGSGNYSTGNKLTLSGGGRVFDTDGLVGYLGGASNNAVSIGGTGSVWSNRNNIYIGDYGSGNSLTVANGGAVANNSGYIGLNTGANNNTVTVTGAGSTWNNRGELYVGYQGSGSTLTISNGGTVFNNGVNMGAIIGGGAGAGDNAVLVTGSNSVWHNSSDVWVGSQGSGNTLTVCNGGQVYNDNGVIGDYGSNNAVLVTGTGSVWSNSNALFIGWERGGSNRLTIADGGRVYSRGRSAEIGVLPDTGNNLVLVTGAGSVWNNGTNLYVGWDSSDNALIITNGGRVLDSTAFIGRGANIGAGYPSNANHNAVLVTGPGSVWTNSGDLFVGNSGSGNNLTIADGGTVFNNYGYIGYTNGANHNAVLVNGAGSRWANALGLNVGHSGSSNSLTITNGGRVNNYSDIGIGYLPGANHNAVTLTGTDSVWSSTGDLYMGGGSGNSLTIADGGKLYNYTGSIGCYSSASSNNTVLVTGADSVWRNLFSALHVGKVGSGNSLTIANGGTVYNDSEGVIGYFAAASNNAVTVTGTGSVWNNTGNLTVGNQGSGNTLSITNGGTVHAQSVTLGMYASSSNNALAVSGADSSLVTTNAGFGVLDVRNGTVTMESGTILANLVCLTNGANGAFTMSGGTLAVNTLANDGSANVQLAGGTLRPLNADADWSAALTVSNSMTLSTLDAGGLVRTNTLSGTLSGGGTLNVVGAGRLGINGTDTSGGWINVQDGATLGGVGSMAHVQVFSNATLAAGNSIGVFTATNLALAGGAHLQVELNATGGVAGVDWDLIRVNGPAALSGISSNVFLSVDVINYGGLDGALAPLTTLSWNILDASGGITGYDPGAFVVNPTGFDGWTNGTWSVTQADNSLLVAYVAIPEPVSAMLVFLLGSVLVGCRRVRRWGR